MKYLLTLTILFFASVSFAQIQPGARLLSGRVNFQGNVEDFGDQRNISHSLTFAPSFNRFVTDSKTLDLGVSYTLFRFKTVDEDNTNARTVHELRTQAGFTHYKSLADRFYLTLGYGLGVGYGRDITGTNDDDPEGVNSFGAGAEVDLGLSYFFGERWIVNAGLGSVSYELRFTERRNDEDGFDVRHQYGLGTFVNSFSITISYFLDPVFTE